MFQTFTPVEYLKIDIANNFGLDKFTWQERLDWFDQNWGQLDKLISKAKEPALFYAGIKAYCDVLAGRPIGYMISLDATSSGLQLLAILTGDRKAASICNVIDTGDREDAYQDIYQEMLRRVQDTSKISHENVKQAIMTSLYGSTAVPKEVFGEGSLLNTFYQTMVDMAPGAWELNEAFLEMWDSSATENSWVLPDNFHVHIKVMNQVRETVHFLNEPFDVFYNINAPVKEGRSLGANTIHSIDGLIVRELTRRCDYDPDKLNALRDIMAKGKRNRTSKTRENDKMVVTLWNHFKETGYLSARIIDYLDDRNYGLVNSKAIVALLDTFPAKPFKVVSVHDCFRCLPTYGNDLRRQYNLQLELIANSNLLQCLISQLVGHHVSIGKLDPTLHREIREANYALS